MKSDSDSEDFDTVFWDGQFDKAAAPPRAPAVVCVFFKKMLAVGFCSAGTRFVTVSKPVRDRHKA